VREREICNPIERQLLKFYTFKIAKPKWASRNLKRDLDHNEKRPDNHPVYEFESMPFCKFVMLFAITRKLSKLMTATMMTIEDDNEPKDISRQTSC
jgi:hypothetical protein